MMHVQKVATSESAEDDPFHTLIANAHTGASKPACTPMMHLKQ